MQVIVKYIVPVLVFTLLLPVLSAAAPGSSSINGIIGPDDRYEAPAGYPFDAVVKVVANWTARGGCVGSGFLVDEFHVLTAAHVVDDASWGVAPHIRVIPGLDDGREPFGHARVTKVRTKIQWTGTRDYRQDMALLTLDRPIGKLTGWMTYATADPENAIYTGNVFTAGFPGDLEMGTDTYTTNASGDGADDFMHYQWLDSYPGQSGSPIWYRNGSRLYVISILAYGGISKESNAAVRINADKAITITSWLTEDAVAPPSDLPDLVDRGMAWYPFNPIYYPSRYGEISSSKVYAGLSTFTASCEVANVGTAPAPPSEVSFVVSRDRRLDGNDYVLGRANISSLDTAGYDRATWSGTFPSIPPGEYYVGWLLDPDGAVEEADENNTVLAPYTITVQTLGPYTQVKLDGTIGEGGWYRGPVRVTLNGTSSGSAINGTFYIIDGSSFVPYESPFIVSGNGVHTLRCYSSDVGGLEEPMRTVTISIDGTAPVISVFEVRRSDGILQVTWRASDEHSGVERVEISSDGTQVLSSDSSAGTAEIPAYLSENVTITVYDRAGNAVKKEASGNETASTTAAAVAVLLVLIMVYIVAFAVVFVLVFLAVAAALVMKLVLLAALGVTVYLLVKALTS